MPLKDVDAYWINPDGALVAVTDTHIKTVLEKPEAFGLSYKYLEGKYRDFKESIGSEGQARDLVVDRLTRSGWIRIRYYPEDDNYLIQLGRLKQTEGDFLQDWAEQLIGINKSRETANAVIDESSAKNKHTVTTVGDIAKGILYKGIDSNLPKKRIFILNSVKDL